MSRQFANRVRMERATLRAINTKFQGCKLHGISSRAIDRWERDVTTKLGIPELSVVVAGLHEMSSACQALADQSRRSFDPAKFDLEKTRDLLSGLESTVANLLSIHTHR
jgi:hypothetical protein